MTVLQLLLIVWRRMKMGLRYRKSIKILPGVRVNFGLKSTSISLGGRGFRTTYSSTGRVTRSVGIPGTGLSYVTTETRGRNRQNNNRSNSRNTTIPRTTEYYESYSPMVEATPVQSEAKTVTKEAVYESINAIYSVSDEVIDWKNVLISDSDGTEKQDYFKDRAEKILNGDIDTYFEVISDLNPLDDLIQYGSEFECGTDDPRMIGVHFEVNSSSVLKDAKDLSKQDYNELLQDYVCGCAIRVARDMFALLPLRHIIINASDKDKLILSVDFKKRAFLNLDFENSDASDIVEQFENRMNFDSQRGFSVVEPID